ncbi:MAG: hypothetical protein JO360_02630 [Acidobacteria bacterium]|nr:hypothetical protein [Acidobacteriota bacterium]
MKKAVTIILIIIGAIAIFYFADPFHDSLAELSTISPNKTYKVNMQERVTLDVEHVVYFNVVKTERPLIEHEIFYSDSSQFIYPDLKYSWAAENVLCLNDFDSSIKPDEISVINQTDKVIRYLKIDATSSSFLLLEVQPQTTTRLLARPQTDRRADISWIGGFGKFDDGSEFANWGRNFQIRGKYSAPAHYCVFIRDGEVVVQSREFEGFRIDSSGKIVEMPEAKNEACQ